MKTRIFIILILIVLFTIFVTQNTDIVKLHVFFWDYEFPKITAFVITAVVGVLFGFILASFFRPSKKNKSKDIVSPPNISGKDKDDLTKENI